MAEFPSDPILNLQSRKWYGSERYKDRGDKLIRFQEHLSSLGIEKAQFKNLRIVRFDKGEKLSYWKKNDSGDVVNNFDQDMKKSGYALVMVTDEDAYDGGTPLVGSSFISSKEKGHGVDGKILNPVASFYSNQRFDFKKDERGEQQIVNLYLDIGTRVVGEELSKLSALIDKDANNVRLTHGGPGSNYNNVDAYNPEGSKKMIEAETKSIKINTAKLKLNTGPLLEQEYAAICQWNAQLTNDLAVIRTNQIKSSTRNLEDDMVELTRIKERLALNQNINPVELKKLEDDIKANEVTIQLLRGKGTGRDPSHLGVRTKLNGRQILTFHAHKEDFDEKLKKYNKENGTKYGVKDIIYDPSSNTFVAGGTQLWGAGNDMSSYTNVSDSPENLAPQTATARSATEISVQQKETAPGVLATHIVELTKYKQLSVQDLMYRYQSMKNDPVQALETNPLSQYNMMRRALVYKIFSSISGNNGQYSAKRVFEQLGGGDAVVGKKEFALLLRDTIFAESNPIGGDLAKRLGYAVYISKDLQSTSQSSAFGLSGNAAMQYAGLGSGSTTMTGAAPRSTDDIIIDEAITLLTDKHIRGADANLPKGAIADVLKSDVFANSTDAADVFRQATMRLGHNLGDAADMDFASEGMSAVTKLVGVEAAKFFGGGEKTAKNVEQALNVAGQLAHSAAKLATLFHGARAGLNLAMGSFKWIFGMGDKGVADFAQAATSGKAGTATWLADLGMSALKAPLSFRDEHDTLAHMAGWFSEDFKNGRLEKQVSKNLEGLQTHLLSEFMEEQLFANRPASDLVGPGKLIREKNGAISVDPQQLKGFATNPAFEDILKQSGGDSILNDLAAKMAQQLADDGLTVAELTTLQNSSEQLSDYLAFKRKKNALRNNYGTKLGSLGLVKQDIMDLQTPTELAEKEQILILASDQLAKLDGLTTSSYFSDPTWIGATYTGTPAKQMNGSDFATILSLQDAATAPATPQTARAYIQSLLTAIVDQPSVTAANSDITAYAKSLAYLSQTFLKTKDIASAESYRDETTGDPKTMFDYFTLGHVSQYPQFSGHSAMTPPGSWTHDPATSTITPTEDRKTMIGN